MTKANKAQRATSNRILKRYGGTVYESENVLQIRSDERLIDIATTASLGEALQRLRFSKQRAYVAITNLEALAAALRITRSTKVGVMDPQGNIVREAES